MKRLDNMQDYRFKKPTGKFGQILARLGMPGQVQGHFNHHGYFHGIPIYYFIQNFISNGEASLKYSNSKYRAKRICIH